MGKREVNVWAFDSQGDMIKDSFETEREAETWAENHGLEIFKIEGN